MRLRAVLMMAFAVVAFVPRVSAGDDAKVTHFWFTVYTQNEDKDADTIVNVHLVCNNNVVASSLGVGYGRRFPRETEKPHKNTQKTPDGITHWTTDPDAYEEVALIDNFPSKKELRPCGVKVTAQANGNDHWTFRIFFTADFQDGDHLVIGEGLNGDLNSRGSSEVAQYFPFQPRP